MVNGALILFAVNLLYLVLYVTLVDTGRKYGMEINIDKSQVMRVSRSNESLQIKVNNRKPKEVDHFKYLGSLLIDGYCTREIKGELPLPKNYLTGKYPSSQAS